MANINRTRIPTFLFGGALILLAGCDQSFDFDLRSLGGGFNTTDAARRATAARPQTDDRGIISYPNFQVAVARDGDQIGDIASRVGIPADELARYNGIPLNVTLRRNEVIALPRRVAEPSSATGAVQSGIDISSLAGNAIDRADSAPTPTNPPSATQPVQEPIRHKVEPGETAFSISRLYNVSVRALSEWNGLGPDLSVRSGQYLLIPVAAETASLQDQTTTPGQGSPTPEPPSATTALPDATSTAAVASPNSPNLGSGRTDASGVAKLAMPVSGNIIRPYAKGKNDGIDIAATAGSSVVAAEDGTVAAITRDTELVPVVILKHANDLLTVYAGVDGLTIKKGDRVKRGQKIAVVRAGNPSFLHFEVRQWFDSFDPVPFLN